jgi:TonB-linked SusC/RagA family outer membrane protein
MKKIILLLLLCSSLFTAFSQRREVSGFVYGNEEALPGASVVIKGSSTGTSTDLNGQFSLFVSDKDSLLVSFIGYESKTVAANSNLPIQVMLSLSSQQLREIVVTALGEKRDKRNLGYVVQKIESKDLNEVKAVNFVDNLSAKFAGVTISQGATGVGSTSKINIRGEASFTNNNPLFVVDGTPVNNNTVVPFTTDAAAGFQEIDFGNGAMDINPDDVESVSILKGPAAAALYGTRAANGVVLITTKDGSRQEGMGISFNSTTSLERAFQLPRFQNKYGQGNSGQFEFVDGLGGGTNDNISYSWGPRLDAGLLIPQFDSPTTAPDGSIVRGGDVAVHGGAPISATPFRSYKNNLRDFYETGLTTINNLAVSSAFKDGNMRLSYTDLRSKSIIPGVNLDRKTLAAKMNIRSSEQLSFSSSINYINSQSDNRPSNGYGSENVNYALVAWGPRSLNIGALEDYWQPGLENTQQYSFNYTFFDNPYFTLLENRNSFNRNRLFGNLMATYQVDEFLKVSFRSGMDYSSELRQFRRAFSSNRFKNGAYAEHQVGYRENNTDLLINYQRKLGLISTDFSLGANRLDQRASTTQTQTTQLAQPGVFSLGNAAAPLEVFQADRRKRINSVYGIAKLAYKDLVFVDITARNDWSSALATFNSSANTSFFYPSVSSSFIASNVFHLPQAISFLKLRASLAQVGNDTDPYQTEGSFLPQVVVNGQPTLSEQNTIANAGLKPEQTTSFESGVDIRFFNDRLVIDLTYYNALTKNQIISLPVSITSGYTQQVVNGGEVRSKGLEAIISTQLIQKEDFQWKLIANFSRNVSTVESLPQTDGRLTLGYSSIYDNVNQTVWFQVEEGGKIGDMYGTGYKKTSDGRYLVDANGNLIADNELKKIGNYNPDFILGLTNQFSYKNWDAGILLDWRQGGELVSRTLALAGVGGQLEETEFRPENGFIIKGVVNQGTETNPVYVENTTAISAESYYRQYYDRNHEEHNTYNASYLKIREVSIAYTFKNTGNKGLLQEGRSLRLSLIARNLYAFSEIPHFDPEQLAVQGQQFVSGVEDMSYATSRSIGIKASLTF